MSVSFLPFSLAASYSHFPPPLFGLVVLLFSDGSFERLLHPFTPPFFGTFVFLLLHSLTITTTTTTIIYWNRTEQMTYTVWRAEVHMTMMGLMGWRGSWLNGKVEKEAVAELERGCCCLLINL
jgi:hypothetical protein